VNFPHLVDLDTGDIRLHIVVKPVLEVVNHPFSETGRAAVCVRVRPNLPALLKLFRTSSAAVDPAEHCHCSGAPRAGSQQRLVRAVVGSGATAQFHGELACPDATPVGGRAVGDHPRPAPVLLAAPIILWGDPAVDPGLARSVRRLTGSSEAPRLGRCTS
jgi:hypothetical protein